MESWQKAEEREQDLQQSPKAGSHGEMIRRTQDQGQAPDTSLEQSGAGSSCPEVERPRANTASAPSGQHEQLQRELVYHAHPDQRIPQGPVQAHHYIPHEIPHHDQRTMQYLQNFQVANVEEYYHHELNNPHIAAQIQRQPYHTIPRQRPNTHPTIPFPISDQPQMYGYQYGGMPPNVGYHYPNVPPNICDEHSHSGNIPYQVPPTNREAQSDPGHPANLNQGLQYKSLKVSDTGMEELKQLFVQNLSSQFSKQLENATQQVISQNMHVPSAITHSFLTEWTQDLISKVHIEFQKKSMNLQAFENYPQSSERQSHSNPSSGQGSINQKLGREEKPDVVLRQRPNTMYENPATIKHIRHQSAPVETAGITVNLEEQYGKDERMAKFLHDRDNMTQADPAVDEIIIRKTPSETNEEEDITVQSMTTSSSDRRRKKNRDKILQSAHKIHQRLRDGVVGKELNILLLGMPGVGKSSLVNSMFMAVSNIGYKELATRGSYGTGGRDGKSAVTLVIKGTPLFSAQLFKGEPEMKYDCQPVFYDCPGFPDTDDRNITNIIRLVIEGKMKDRTNIVDLQKINEKEMKKKFDKTDHSRKIHVVIVVHAATDPIPEALLGSIKDAVAPAQTGVRGVPLLAVITKIDQLKTETEQDRVVDDLATELGMTGATEKIFCTKLYCNDVTPGLKRNPEIDSNMCLIWEHILRPELLTPLSKSKTLSFRRK